MNQLAEHQPHTQTAKGGVWVSFILNFYQKQTKKIHFLALYFFLRGDKINFFA